MEVTKETKRAKNWEWDDTYAFVVLVHKHGKNWDKILTILHKEQHRCSHIEEPDKLRNKWNSLASSQSTLKKQYKRPKFQKPKGSAEEIKQAEAIHAAKYEAISKQWEHAQLLVQEVTERETTLSSNARKSAAEVSADLKAKGEERRKIRDERLEQYNNDAAQDREFRKVMMDTLRSITQAMAQSIANETEYINLLKRKHENEDNSPNKVQKL